MILSLFISSAVLTNQENISKQPQSPVVLDQFVAQLREKYSKRDRDIFDTVFPEKPKEEPPNYYWKLRIQKIDEQFTLYCVTKRNSLIPVYS